MRRSYPKTWGKQFERYCDEYLPEWKTEICDRAAITGMSAMRARRQKSMRGWRKSDERKWCFKKMKSEYDNELFFNEYAKMARSQGGLRGGH